MPFLTSPLLTIIWILSFGFFGALIIRAEDIVTVRQWCLFTSLAALFVGVCAALSFDKAAAGYQFMNSFNFISQYNMSFAVGVDGLSFVFLLLTLVTFPPLFLAA